MSLPRRDGPRALDAGDRLRLGAFAAILVVFCTAAFVVGTIVARYIATL